MPRSEMNGLPSQEDYQIGAAFAALADPCRRLIVRELLGEPEGARRQCSSFGVNVSKSTMTHHFRILREAGFVDQFNYGNCSELTLRRAEIDSRFPGLLDLLVERREMFAPSNPSKKASSNNRLKAARKTPVKTKGVSRAKQPTSGSRLMRKRRDELPSAQPLSSRRTSAGGTR